MTRQGLAWQIGGIVVTIVLAVSLAGQSARPSAVDAVKVGNDDIGGVVTGPRGPEAGVWVIAETKDLATRLIKIVVTDDRGRYLLPGLPKSSYDVWVRGYEIGRAHV